MNYLNDNEVIQQWLDTKKQMEALREREVELRNEVLKRKFAGKLGHEGTVNSELGNGYKLKAVFKKTYGFTDTEKLGEMLDYLETQSPEYGVLVDRLVTYSPKLSVSEFKQLPDHFLKQFEKVVVIKDAQPTLSLVEPKDK